MRIFPGSHTPHKRPPCPPAQTECPGGRSASGSVRRALDQRTGQCSAAFDGIIASGGVGGGGGCCTAIMVVVVVVVVGEMRRVESIIHLAQSRVSAFVIRI